MIFLLCFYLFITNHYFYIFFFVWWNHCFYIISIYKTIIKYLIITKMQPVKTTSLDIVKNYQQLSSRASWKRFSSVAGSPKTRRLRPTSSLSDDFHGKRKSNTRLELKAGDDGDWFVVLWLIRGCESMSIAADGAIDEGSENLWTIKNWWLFLIWILEDACVRQYIYTIIAGNR